MIELKHDGKLDFAVGKSRGVKKWSPKELNWSWLVNKLSTTTRTFETLGEYKDFKRMRQDEIKDVGGFIGGMLTKGSRKKGSIIYKQIITLDADFAHPYFWQDFQLMFDNAACVYSTHKHTPTNPRLRLVLPIDRQVNREEYEAIARKVAGMLDIELFDNTSFEPERLMYYPSTSKDGEFLFEYQDGPWLCADEILGMYHDWRDNSLWPISEKVNKAITNQIKTQQDPLSKTGTIGYFCRTYNIHEAIETFLPHLYEMVGDGERYTYKLGEGYAGLLVFGDVFTYSKHNTDPTNNILCSAFDLVRIHKFRELDDKVDEDTPTPKRPSFAAMMEFAEADPLVTMTAAREIWQEAKDDYAPVAGEEDAYDDAEPDTTWMKKLKMKKNKILSTIGNIEIILQNDPYLKGKIAYDDFEKCEVALRNLPWRKVTNATRRLNDMDDAQIQKYLENAYNISNSAKLTAAMLTHSSVTMFHPVKDYLSSLVWDKAKRIDTLLVDYFGVEQCEYTSAVTRKSLVAAIARIVNPGVKFDHVLTIVGKEGLMKSALIDKLGGKWFSDSFSLQSVGTKEAFEQLQGVWLVEIAELAGMARKDVESIKGFVAKREDRYRVAFGRRVEKFPRQCVFFATTNKLDFLREANGNRRFWPVVVNETTPAKNVIKDLTSDEVGQIWAEAVAMFEKGESLYLPEHLVTVALEKQKQHTEEHPWATKIRTYLETPVPANWSKIELQLRRDFLKGTAEDTTEKLVYRCRVCVDEIWEEVMESKYLIDERSATAIRNIMAGMAGWREEHKPMRYGSYGLQRRGYFREDSPFDEPVYAPKQLNLN